MFSLEIEFDPDERDLLIAELWDYEPAGMRLDPEPDVERSYRAEGCGMVDARPDLERRSGRRRVGMRHQRQLHRDAVAALRA